MMIKKVFQCRPISIAVRVFKTRALTTDAAAVAASPGSSLFRKIFNAPNPKHSITPILDEWITQEKSIEVPELRKIIKQLRQFKRIKHALQISEWMCGKSFLDLSSADAAIQLDLISKVHGVQQAEEFFHNLPTSSKDFRTYGALLVCYADAKLLEKAESVMQMMRDLSYVKTLSCNVMLKLYIQFRKQDKVQSIVQEMEDNGIEFSKFTYNTILNGYADIMDIDQLEKLLLKMENDPLVTMDWNAYIVAAKGYLRVCNKVKAVESLKKSEQFVPARSRNFAYEIYMTMYASMGNKKEVYRIWNLYKIHCKFYNVGYLCMMSSLAKMDDLEAAQKVYDEWEMKKANFDIRLPNFLISAYCKKGLMEEAESVYHRLLRNGKEANAGTLSRLALGYQKKKQMEKAVETLNKSIMASGPGLKLYFPVLDNCLTYLKEKGDLDRIDDIKKLLAERGHEFNHVFERLGKHSKEETNTEFETPEPDEADEFTSKEEKLEVEKEGRA